MESSSSFREARSGSSTPLRHTGPSTLSRGLSLSKVASQAASQDMRRNIEEREQELQKLNAARVSVLEEQLHGLEEQVSNRDNEIEQLQEQLLQLTGDFKYNLKLLEDRDAELERSEASVDGLQKGAEAREAELSDTRHKLNEVQQKFQTSTLEGMQRDQQHQTLVERLTRDLEEEQHARQHEGKASSDKLADLKASSAHELQQLRKQAQEAHSRSAEEADVKLQAAQRAGEKLQGQAQRLQEANGALHKQLADAHGKIESQAVEMARMLEQFEGSLAALREIERQYSTLQENSSQAEHAAALHIAELEREATDSRDVHLSLAAQHEAKIAQLGRHLAEVSQQHDAVSRLYEAESAVAAQCADMVQRSHESISRLEERVSEACSLQAAAEQSRDVMEQQLHQAQESQEGSAVALEREVQLHTQTQADKVQAQQHAEEARSKATAAQAELQALRAQLAQVPRPVSPLLRPSLQSAPLHHPLQSIFGGGAAESLTSAKQARSQAAVGASQEQQWVQEGSKWRIDSLPDRGRQHAEASSSGSQLESRIADLAEQFERFRETQKSLFEQRSPAARSQTYITPHSKHSRHSSPQSWSHGHHYSHSLQPSWDQISQQADEDVCSGPQHHIHRHADRHRRKPHGLAGLKADSQKDIDLAQQQQRMIELLKLRSDELSGENGRLRLQVAAASQQCAQPMQGSFGASHADPAPQQQQVSTASVKQPFTSSSLPAASLCNTLQQDLTILTAAPELSRLRSQVMTARDQLLKMDWQMPDVIPAVLPCEGRRKPSKRLGHVPCIA